MIDGYLLSVLIMLVVSLLHPIVFAAGYLLLLVDEWKWLSLSEAVIPAALALAIPGVTTLNLTAYTTVVLPQGGGFVTFILVLLIVLPLCYYLFFASHPGAACVMSRRFQQATNALMLIYAVVLVLAAVKLISFAIPVSIISTAAIFTISFFLLRRTRMPLFMVMGLGILIAILLIR